jgi:hypothetical protein
MPQFFVEIRNAASSTNNAMDATKKLHSAVHFDNRKSNLNEFEKVILSCPTEWERRAWCSFSEMYEHALLSVLLSTVAPETNQEMTIAAVCPLQNHEQDTLYYIAGWFVRRFIKDIRNIKRFKKFKELIINWMWSPEQAEVMLMPVRKTMLMSKGNLTFACGQVYEMLCEIEKVWRGTVSFAAVWRFKNTALLKSKQLAITCPSVIAKAQLCLKGNATEADVHEFVERSVRHYYLMRQRPFLKRVCVLHAGGFSTALRTELGAISDHTNKSK